MLNISLLCSLLASWKFLFYKYYAALQQISIYGVPNYQTTMILKIKSKSAKIISISLLSSTLTD